jgi:hypothetical protein
MALRVFATCLELYLEIHITLTSASVNLLEATKCQLSYTSLRAAISRLAAKNLSFTNQPHCQQQETIMTTISSIKIQLPNDEFRRFPFKSEHVGLTGLRSVIANLNEELLGSKTWRLQWTGTFSSRCQPIYYL